MKCNPSHLILCLSASAIYDTFSTVWFSISPILAIFVLGQSCVFITCIDLKLSTYSCCSLQLSLTAQSRGDWFANTNCMIWELQHSYSKKAHRTVEDREIVKKIKIKYACVYICKGSKRSSSEMKEFS